MNSHLLRLLLAACLGLLVPATPVLAQRRDSSALEAMRALELQKLSDVASLARTTQQCVRAATSLRALRRCHQREREAEWGIRERHQQRLEAVRSRFGLSFDPRFQPGPPPGAPPGPPPGGPPPWGPPPR